jgi:hypothetical protein
LKTFEALQDALAHLRRIDDAHELETFRAPFQLLKADYPFVLFDEDSGQDVAYPFDDAESAHVITRVVNPAEADAASASEPNLSDKYQARQFKRAPGRDVFTVSAQRLQYSSGIPFYRPIFRKPTWIEGLANDLPSILGEGLAKTVEHHIIWVLMAAAGKNSRGIVETDYNRVSDEVEKAVMSFDSESTVIAAASVTSALMRDSYHFDPERVTIAGKARLLMTDRIGKDLALVVGHGPGHAATVRERTSAEMFVGSRDGVSVSAIATGEYGFFARDNAPLQLIDVGPRRLEEVSNLRGLE